MTNHRRRGRRRKVKKKSWKIIGYTTLGLYFLAIICLVGFVANLGMLPMKYLALLAGLMAALGGIMAVMHRKQVASVIASVLSVLLIFGCGAGSYYILTAQSAINKVTTAGVQTQAVSVYVKSADSAKKIEDAASYKFGMLNKVDRQNTDKTLKDIGKKLGKELAVTDYENMFGMMDALKNGEIQAIVLNDAYIGVIAEAEGYGWAATDLRKLTTVEHEMQAKPGGNTPNKSSSSFVVYLSGIDREGSVSARSRSDVNVLAIVNTETKNILLLSTPRDSYVDYSVTGGAKDKLTHAGIYGIEASMDALQRLYDINVDYYLRMNFTGFVDIIDALGGVEVNSDYDFTANGGGASFHKGINKLDGKQALAFVRERYSFSDGDAQRARDQMEVIRAIIKKAASSSLLSNYSSVLDAIAGSFETNMPADQISKLVKMQLSDTADWNITSFAPTGTSSSSETFSMPGRNLYVLNLSPESVNEAKAKIKEITGNR